MAQAFNTALWRTEPGFQWIPPVAAAEALVVFFGFQLLPRDRRPFAERTPVFLLVFIPGFLGLIGGKWYDAFLHGDVCPSILIVAFAGLARTSRVSVLGRMLVRLLFAGSPFGSTAPDVQESESQEEPAPAPEEDYVSV